MNELPETPRRRGFGTCRLLQGSGSDLKPKNARVIVFLRHALPFCYQTLDMKLDALLSQEAGLLLTLGEPYIAG